jgi:hypothetical protein
MGLFATLSINDSQHKWHAAKWHTELSVIMLSVAITLMLCWVSVCWMSLCWVSWRPIEHWIGKQNKIMQNAKFKKISNYDNLSIFFGYKLLLVKKKWRSLNVMKLLCTFPVAPSILQNLENELFHWPRYWCLAICH